MSFYRCDELTNPFKFLSQSWVFLYPKFVDRHHMIPNLIANAPSDIVGPYIYT